MKKSPAKKKKPNTTNKNGKSEEVNYKAVKDEKKKKVESTSETERKDKKVYKKKNDNGKSKKNTNKKHKLKSGIFYFIESFYTRYI